MATQTAKESKQVQSTYKTTITFICPKRGKVTEEVTVVQYKAQKVPENKPIEFAVSELLGSESMEDLEEAGFHEAVD